MNTGMDPCKKLHLWDVICRSSAVATMSADQFSKDSRNANCHASNLFSIAGVITGLQDKKSFKRARKKDSLSDVLGRPLRCLGESVQ